MKLSDIKGEQSLDLLADLIDPAGEIFSDEKVKTLFDEKSDKKAIVKYMLKNHKKSIIEILAILNGETVETFEFNIFTLPRMVMEVLSDEELLSFFSQYLTEEQ